MSRPLEDALAAIGHATGLGSAAAANAVERADIRNESVTLELRTHGVPRWFQWSMNGLAECRASDEHRLPGAKRLLCSNARVLAYRPSRRLVVDTPDGIWKAFKRGRVDPAAYRHRALSSLDAFVTPTIEEEASDAALRFSRVDGHPLRLDSGAAGTLREIGRRVRRQQEGVLDLEPFMLSDELSVLDTWSARVSWARCGLPRSWNEVREAVERYAAELAPSELVPSHRDLHDGQFLVAGSRVALLDFDLACNADNALDPGNLCAHLTLRAMQGRSGSGPVASEIARAAFLAGLGRTGPEFEQRLHVYETTALLRLALVYSLRPRWEALVDVLVAHAERTLLEVKA